MTATIDLTGRLFGRWRVISYAVPGRNSKWLCRCSCGREQLVQGNSLRHGKSKMCFKCRGRKLRALEVGDLINGWEILGTRKGSYSYRAECLSCSRRIWTWAGWLRKNRCRRKRSN